jgi:hypothetical protein
VTVLEAAEKTGLEMSDYGAKIDTLAIQPGDVVTGTDTGMYLGHGMVLTESGEIKGLTSVMDFDKSNPGVFRMPLPDLPSSGEVLPPEAVASDTVHDAFEQEPPPAHASTDSPMSAPANSPLTVAVPRTSAASDDLPEEVPYQGRPLG